MRDGGQVFPRVPQASRGMDVRTMLAGMAMQGLLAAGQLPDGYKPTSGLKVDPNFIVLSVMYADAMLSELEKDVV